MTTDRHAYLTLLNETMSEHRIGGHSDPFPLCQDEDCVAARHDLAKIRNANAGLLNADPNAGQPGVLRRIAAEMNTVAETFPWQPGMKLKPYRRRLERGLELLRYNNAATSTAVLTLSRQGDYPHPTEEKICRAAFNAPPAPVTQRRTAERDETKAIVYEWTVYVQTNTVHTVKENPG